MLGKQHIMKRQENPLHQKNPQEIAQANNKASKEKVETFNYHITKDWPEADKKMLEDLNRAQMALGGKLTKRRKELHEKTTQKAKTYFTQRGYEWNEIDGPFGGTFIEVKPLVSNATISIKEKEEKNTNLTINDLTKQLASLTLENSDTNSKELSETTSTTTTLLYQYQPNSASNDDSELLEGEQIFINPSSDAKNDDSELLEGEQIFIKPETKVIKQ